MSFWTSIRDGAEGGIKGFYSGGASLIPGLSGPGQGPGGVPQLGALPQISPININNDPYFKAMASRASNYSPVAGLAPQADPYKKKDYSGSLPEFDAMRNQASRQINSQQGAARDNLNRQFAAMGGGPSGAQVKATQNLENQNDINKSDAMDKIGFQEAQTKRGLQEADNNRAFQSQQATAGRNFQGQQFNANLEMQNQMQPFEMNSKLAGLDLGVAQSNQGAQEKQAQLTEDQYNAAMQGYKAQHSGGLLGAGGFLGTGIGA